MIYKNINFKDISSITNVKIAINAENCIYGRFLSVISKLLLENKIIYLYNIEKLILRKDITVLYAKYLRFKKVGDKNKGPIHQSSGSKILRKSIRGMLKKTKKNFRIIKNVISWMDISDIKNIKELKIIQGELMNIKNDRSIKYTTFKEYIEKINNGKYIL